MARKVTLEDFQNDTEAMLTMCMQIADSQYFLVTAAHLATALDAFNRERDLQASGMLSDADQSAPAGQQWFTAAELEKPGSIID